MYDFKIGLQLSCLFGILMFTPDIFGVVDLIVRYLLP